MGLKHSGIPSDCSKRSLGKSRLFTELAYWYHRLFTDQLVYTIHAERPQHPVEHREVHAENIVDDIIYYGPITAAPGGSSTRENFPLVEKLHWIEREPNTLDQDYVRSEYTTPSPDEYEREHLK